MTTALERPDVPDYAALRRGEASPPTRGERRAARRALAAVVREQVGAEAIVAALWGIAQDGVQHGTTRVMAMRVLLDRGWGRPPQLLHVEASASAGEGEELGRVLDEASDAELVAAVELADELTRRLGAGDNVGG